jgi:hypothetical protein
MKTLLASLAITLILAANVSGQTPAISSLTLGGYYGGFTVSGYEFTLSAPLTVTGLGFYDRFVGTGEFPTVNLYDAAGPNAGILLASMSNTPGTGTDTGGITYGSITPVTLSAGTYEVVSSLYYTSNNDTVTFNPAVTLDQYVDGGGSSNFGDTYFTTTTAPSGAEANADIQFASTAVPEPSTWALMVGGIALLVFIQRRPLSKKV